MNELKIKDIVELIQFGIIIKSTLKCCFKKLINAKILSIQYILAIISFISYKICRHRYTLGGISCGSVYFN